MANSTRILGALVLSVSLLGVTACSTGNGDSPGTEDVQPQTASPSTTTSPVATTSDEATESSPTTDGQFPSKKTTPEGAILGEVGKLHGSDCTSEENCSVYFTIEKLDVVEACPGDGVWEPTEGQALLEFQALVDISAEPVTPDYNHGYFTVSTDWSALTEEGVNVPIEGDSLCMAQTDARQGWGEPIYPGDRQRSHQYFSIPANATKLRLTESHDGGRWEFDLPD